METIFNMLGDPEITWDTAAKLKLAQFHHWFGIKENSV